jgi:hypothetical protein
MPMAGPSISPGRIILDEKASHTLSSEDIIPAIERHIGGDWGKVSRRQQKVNQQAFLNLKPFRSVFFTSIGVKFTLETDQKKMVTKIKIV